MLRSRSNTLVSVRRVTERNAGRLTAGVDGWARRRRKSSLPVNRTAQWWTSLSGLVARKRGRTTIRVPGVRVADDLVQRHFVAVEPGHQGHGVGRALLRHAEQIAARANLNELRLYTNAAMVENVAMYPRLGYHLAERRRDNGFDRVFFTKLTPIT
jgi:GNAT superfamily N-acetyltransferase